jgi:flagellar biosynthesis/type III secretory pathway protein FliH
MGRVIKGWTAAAPAIVPAAEDVSLPPVPTPTVVEPDVQAAMAAARRDGFAAGHADAVARAAGLLADAEAEADCALEAAGDAALALASKMAEKIVGRAVALDPAVVSEIVAEALSGCRPGERSVRIRVHPDDLAAVEGRREWLEARANGVGIQFVADQTVGRYGCVIDTTRGRIDGRLQAQLTALEQAIRGEERDG